MTTTTINDRLDFIEEMGKENQALLDSIKRKAEGTTQAQATHPPRIFLTFLMGMSLGLSLGAGVVLVAGLIFMH